jgi:hypothetical protein
MKLMPIELRGRGMRGWLLAFLVIGGVVLNPTGAAAEDRSGPDALPSFPRGVYWAGEQFRDLSRRTEADRWALAEELIARLAERHHVNVIWVTHTSLSDVARLGEIAQQHGVKVLASGEKLHQIEPGTSPKRLRDLASRTAEALREEAGIGGYVLRDEPRQSQLGALDHYRRVLHQHDPNRPSVTIARTNAYQAVVGQTELPIVCMDVYPFFGSDSPDGPSRLERSQAYYRMMTKHAGRLADEAGVVPWVMPQAFQRARGGGDVDEAGHVVLEAGSHQYYRMPSRAEMRWQSWTALANGARGLVYFALGPNPPERSPDDQAAERFPRVDEALSTGHSPALLLPDGGSSDQLKELGKTYGFISEHAELLKRLRPLGWPLHRGTGPVTAGAFYDEQTGERVVIAVNDDVERERTTTLQLLPVFAEAEVMGADIDGSRTSRLETLEDGFTPLALRVPPGGGRVVRLSLWQSRAAGLLLDQRFETVDAAQAVAWSDLERRPRQRLWGVRQTTALQAGDTGGRLTVDMGELLDGRSRPKRLYITADLSSHNDATLVTKHAHGQDERALRRDRLTAVPAETRELVLSFAAGEGIDRLRIIGVW